MRTRARPSDGQVMPRHEAWADQYARVDRAVRQIRPPPPFAEVPGHRAGGTMCVGYAFARSGRRNVNPLDSSSRRFRPILDMMQPLDLTDNERAILITALRRLVNFDPLSPQTQALKAILERLEPQNPSPYPILRAPAKRVGQIPPPWDAVGPAHGLKCCIARCSVPGALPLGAHPSQQ